MNSFIPKIMIIDHSGLGHGVKFAMAKYRLKKKSKPTFVIYGYLMQLQFLYNKIRPSTVVIACDSKKSKRKKIFKGYKDRAPKSEKDQQLNELAIPQIQELKDKVLPSIGYKNVFEAKGLEADDIIAQVCKDYPQADIIIVTRDKDMYQCLSSTVTIFDPYLKKFFTIYDFKEKYGITPKEWVKVKQIGGCESDTVPGVSGVRETTALKYIKGDLPTHYKTYQNIKSEKKVIKRNKSLVKLPFKGTPSFKIHPDKLKLKGFKKICKKYGFKSFKEDMKHWRRTLKLR